MYERCTPTDAPGSVSVCIANAEADEGRADNELVEGGKGLIVERDEELPTEIALVERRERVVQPALCSFAEVGLHAIVARRQRGDGDRWSCARDGWKWRCGANAHGDGVSGDG